MSILGVDEASMKEYSVAQLLLNENSGSSENAAAVDARSIYGGCDLSVPRYDLDASLLCVTSPRPMFANYLYQAHMLPCDLARSEVDSLGLRTRILSLGVLWRREKRSLPSLFRIRSEVYLHYNMLEIL